MTMNLKDTITLKLDEVRTASRALVTLNDTEIK